jgi:hypothetical protein
MKYLIIAVALVASLATADFAQARHRRGCSSCSAGGCPGGVCALPAGPAQKGYAAAVPQPEAAVAAAAAPVPQTNAVAYRRFGRRR